MQKQGKCYVRPLKVEESLREEVYIECQKFEI